MKYFITTLAVNEPYFTKSLEFHKQLSTRTKDALYNITTTEADIVNFELTSGQLLSDTLTEYPNIRITTLEQFNTIFAFPLEKKPPVDFAFNLNLKVLALKACVKSVDEFDYVIFMDGDWNIYDGFDEAKILNALSLMEREEYDFAFERPALVGPAKDDPNCFFPQKIRDYNVTDHEVWDEAHVVNEQFLIFKNNWKFRLFAMKWEQFLWYSIANDIMNYPDGFEIGVAALESKMKWSFYGIFGEMRECFYFYDKYGQNKYIRF